MARITLKQVSEPFAPNVLCNAYQNGDGFYDCYFYNMDTSERQHIRVISHSTALTSSRNYRKSVAHALVYGYIIRNPLTAHNDS